MAAQLVPSSRSTSQPLKTADTAGIDEKTLNIVALAGFTALILVKTHDYDPAGHEILDEIKDQCNILNIRKLYGPYNMVFEVEAPNMPALHDTIWKIRHANGVQESVTLITEN